MNLSPHFTLHELTFSQTAARHGINNIASPAIIGKLTRLCEILELVRNVAGCPISVSSGYRCPALNRIVPNSAKNSAHMSGLAADIHCNKYSAYDLGRLIIDSGIEFDQLIYEYKHWVHISIPEADKAARKEVLTKIKGHNYMNGWMK